MAMKGEQKPKMTRQEAGRKGGQKVARERGPEFYRRIGKRGGEKVAGERGSEFYREIGRKGGESRRGRVAGTKGAPDRERRTEASRKNKRINVNR